MSEEPASVQNQEATAELEDRWRRAVADLDNQRKRFAREMTRERLTERNSAMRAWLPVLDNLERALESAQHGEAAHPVVGGVRAVRDQAVELLARQGYPRQDETGVPFDPYRHEVVDVVDDPDYDDGIVVRVVRPGYGEGETQLRPAAVVVNRRG
jgi:molecular chaperone GrpE